VVEHDSGNATLSERSVAELLKQLSDQTQTLVRQEFELARVELTEKGKQAGIGAGMFGAAGMLGLYALGALTAAIVLAISLAVTGWLAALITAALYGAVAGILALNGKGRVSRGVPPVPEQTVQTVREDIAVVEQSAREGRR
jgi:uncharacterized membrane protein YqjE